MQIYHDCAVARRRAPSRAGKNGKGIAATKSIIEAAALVQQVVEKVFSPRCSKAQGGGAF